MKNLHAHSAVVKHYTCSFFIELAPDVFRDRNHIINYCEFCLSRDIETNPGPPVVDPSKTIVAPYSQGNVVVC